KKQFSEMGIDIFFNCKNYHINSNKLQILDLLLTTYENSILKNIELEKANKELVATRIKANIELQKRTHDLNERVKELNCLYGIDEISMFIKLIFASR
ncbi:unnamed protein product, partial [marine sediment metagenome]